MRRKLQIPNPKYQEGQTVLILLLVMTVALAIGLAVIQKSLTDVSTASRVEESSRAFSAAEAGIERALQGDTQEVVFSENNSSATVKDSGLLPLAKQPLEYPPLAKEDVAHVWLANPNTDPVSAYYSQSSLDVYWGLPDIIDPNDRPALELTIVYLPAGGSYQTQKFYLDPNSLRSAGNGFTNVSGGCSNNLPPINTSMGNERTFYCKRTITGLNQLPILVRARLLYNITSQPLAIAPVGGCEGFSCSLPPQARVIVSTGVSGSTRRRIQVFKLDKVVPPYFDYAIFSVGDINK